MQRSGLSRLRLKFVSANVEGFYDNAAQVNTEDYLVRKFLHGTFLNMIAMEHIIIKRKHNQGWQIKLRVLKKMCLTQF